MCSILKRGATVLDAIIAAEQNNASIGAAIRHRCSIEIVRHLTLEYAIEIIRHDLDYVLHFRRGGLDTTVGSHWCQPFRISGGGALFATGHRRVMRELLGRRNRGILHSPIEAMADNWSAIRGDAMSLWPSRGIYIVEMTVEKTTEAQP